MRAATHKSIVWSYPDLKEVFLSLARNDSAINIPSSARRQIFVLIDAMDESEDKNERGQQRAEVLSLFTQLHSSAGLHVIKCIIISRPANDIEKLLEGFCHIELQKENRADIERIIDSRRKSIYESMLQNSDNEVQVDSEYESSPSSFSPRMRSRAEKSSNGHLQTLNSNTIRKALTDCHS
jgi:hypothetical protein